MTSQRPLTLLLLLLLPVYCSSAQPSQVVRMNLTTIITPNQRLSGDPYLTFSPYGLKACAEVCKRRPKCLSFNFKRSSGTCELNDRSSSSAGASLLSEEGTIFSDSSSWPNNIIGPCETHLASCSQWSRCETGGNDAPFCILTECKEDPPTVSNASLAGAVTHEIGHSVNYTCDSGIAAPGNAISTCLVSGKWSQPDFSCLQCGAPPNVQDATPSATDATAGSTLTYSCNTGFQVQNGPAEATCDKYGNWQTPSFSCPVVDCGPVPTVDYATPIDNSSTTYGSVIRYECDYTHYPKNGPVEVVCCAGGSWVGFDHHCMELRFTSHVFGNRNAFVSPGFPGAYSDGMNITISVFITSPLPNSVNIEMTCDMEPNPYGGCFDYVQINGGVEKYCGVNKKAFNFKILVDRNPWTVNFVSNPTNVRSRGFRIIYHVV